MELVVNQEIYYSNKKLVPIKEVAESLIALEGIIRHAPDVLEALFPGTSIDSVDIFIQELRSDSIWEDIVIKFIFGSQSKFDNFIETVRERIGMDNLMKHPELMSAIILVLILTGGAYYLGKDSSSTAEQRATIQANNNTIINIGAGMMEMSAEDFKVLIDGTIKDKVKLAKYAVRVVKPAKRESNSSITFNKNKELSIRNETVRAMPHYVSEPEDEEYIQDYEDIEMELRATDLDSIKRGWAVVLPRFGDKRVRLQLDPGVSPEDVSKNRAFRGNATVIFGFDKDQNKIPKLVFLREIVE